METGVKKESAMGSTEHTKDTEGEAVEKIAGFTQRGNPLRPIFFHPCPSVSFVETRFLFLE